jgi:hypothetical protein
LSNREKLIRQLLLRPTDMRFDEVAIVLRYYGYERKKGSGTSHRRFVCPGKNPIGFPVSGDRVKRVYLVEIIKLLGLEEEAV